MADTPETALPPPPSDRTGQPADVGATEDLTSAASPQVSPLSQPGYDVSQALSDELSSLRSDLPGYTPPDTSAQDAQIEKYQHTAEESEKLAEGITAERSAKEEKFATELSAQDAQYNQLFAQHPARQVFYGASLQAAPLMSMLAVLGGKAAGLSGRAMLGAMNGMMEGLNTGSEEQYQQHLDAWKQQIAAYKERHEQQLEIYNLMLDAYKGRADAALKARDFALDMTKDTMDERDKVIKNSIDIFRARTDALTDVDKLALLFSKEKARVFQQQPNQAEVDAIGNYQLPPRTGRAGDAIMSAVAAKYPHYDATTYASKAKLLASFAAGKDAGTLDSINTVVAHLQQLKGLTAALNSGNVQLINSWRNKIRTWLGSDAPTNFAAVRDLASAEVNKMVTGGPGAEEDRKQARKTFLDAASPSQLIGATDQVSGLLVGRLDPIAVRFQAVTQLPESVFASRLTPETQALWRAHHGQGPTGNPAQAPAPGQPRPAAGRPATSPGGAPQTPAQPPQAGAQPPRGPRTIQAGAIAVLDGVKYRKGEDGKWYTVQ
jgi:hypothetical protein